MYEKEDEYVLVKPALMNVRNWLQQKEQVCSFTL